MLQRLIIILGLSLGSLFVQAQTQVQLILDASGSMFNELGSGEARIDAAKQVLTEFVEGLPSGDLDIGLRIYGANTSATDDGACEDSELVVPISGVDKDALLQAVSATSPQGATPIALSLERAAADFPQGGDKVVILVTDGEESQTMPTQARRSG